MSRVVTRCPNITQIEARVTFLSGYADVVSSSFAVLTSLDELNDDGGAQELAGSIQIGKSQIWEEQETTNGRDQMEIFKKTERKLPIMTV